MKFMDVLDPLQMRKGGLLWKPIKQATGLTDAQMIGIGALATGGAIAAPALLGAAGGGAAAGAGAASTAGTTAGAAGATQGGLLSQAGSIMGPISQGLQISNQVAAMNQAQPMQPGQLQQRPGPDLSQFIAAEGQRNQMMDAERQKRLQQQQMALGGLFGGANGRIA